MNAHKLSALLFAGFASQACASQSEHTPIDWEGGARHARIVEIYSAATPVAHLPACLASLPPGALTTRQFVKARYRHVRMMVNAIAEVPDASAFHVNDVVELRPADCSEGKFARIDRTLVPASK